MLVLIQGGVRLIKDVRDGRGVKGKADKCGKGTGVPSSPMTTFTPASALPDIGSM